MKRVRQGRVVYGHACACGGFIRSYRASLCKSCATRARWRRAGFGKPKPRKVRPKQHHDYRTARCESCGDIRDSRSKSGWCRACWVEMQRGRLGRPREDGHPWRKP